MTTLQEQYTTLARSGQEAAVAVVDAWTRSIKEAASRLPVGSAQATTHQVIDQVFDFAVTVVDVQRNFTKQLVTSTTAVAEGVAEQATKAASEATRAATSGTGRAKKSAE
jgi:hypothetical protein